MDISFANNNEINKRRSLNIEFYTWIVAAADFLSILFLQWVEMDPYIWEIKFVFETSCRKNLLLDIFWYF